MIYCRMDVGLFQAYPKTFILTPPCKTRRPKKGVALFLPFRWPFRGVKKIAP